MDCVSFVVVCSVFIFDCSSTEPEVQHVLKMPCTPKSKFLNFENGVRFKIVCSEFTFIYS